MPFIEPIPSPELSDSSLNALIDALIKRNDDLASQNEKIVSQNDQLIPQNAEISKQNQELWSKLNLSLEKLRDVKDRVTELSFDDASLRFSQYSIPNFRMSRCTERSDMSLISFGYSINSQSTSPTDLQPVAFPDGSWPEMEQGEQPSEYPPIVSVKQIWTSITTAGRLAKQIQDSTTTNSGELSSVFKTKLQEHIGVPILLCRAP